MAEYRLRNIPFDLWRRFRVICLEADTTLNAKVIDLVRKEVERVDRKEARQK